MEPNVVRQTRCCVCHAQRAMKRPITIPVSIRDKSSEPLIKVRLHCALNCRPAKVFRCHMVFRNVSLNKTPRPNCKAMICAQRFPRPKRKRKKAIPADGSKNPRLFYLGQVGFLESVSHWISF